MEKVRLGDICIIQSGGTPSRSKSEFWQDGNIPWVKISDINGKFLIDTEEKITEKGLNESSAKLFPKGTILFSIFATLGETTILKINAATNQAIAGLKIKDKNVCDEYLYYYLVHLKKHVNAIGRGVAQNNINLTMLKKIKINVPSVSKQLQICSTLKRIEQVIESRKMQVELLDKLIKSRFNELIKNTDKKDLKTINEICSTVTDGTHQSPKFVENGIPFLLVSNLSNNDIDYYTDKFISSETYANLIKRTPVEIGDVLLTIVGSYGHPAVVKSNKKFLFQRHIAYLKPKKNIVNSIFLYGFFLSDIGQRQIEKKVRGIAQKTLNLSELKNIVIPVIDMQIQNEFADFVAHIDKSRKIALIFDRYSKFLDTIHI